MTEKVLFAAEAVPPASTTIAIVITATTSTLTGLVICFPTDMTTPALVLLLDRGAASLPQCPFDAAPH